MHQRNQPARAVGGGDSFPPHHSHFEDGPGGAAVSAARDEDLASYPENQRKLQEVGAVLCGCSPGGPSSLLIHR